MRKIYSILMGVYCYLSCITSYGAEKFDVLPDLPEPLAAAQASSVSTTANDTSLSNIASQSVGSEPNLISMVFSLVFVVLLIYITGIIYAKLNNFGLKTLKKQITDNSSSKVAVVSTTALGNNKCLHVVELDGKRMLIGSSTNSINLIKDLGKFPPAEIESTEFSKIEIPNIRIPKIEIPKIEFPNIGFTKASPKFADDNEKKDNTEEKTEQNVNDNFEISEIYEESPDGIIDKLFQNTEHETAETENNAEKTEHKVNPEEYALYKKYL